MAIRIISALITILVDAVAAVAVLFTMLIAMNGYSESDATPGLVTFLVLSLMAAFTMSGAAFIFAGKLVRRGTRAPFAVLISAPIASVAGVILIVVSCFVGIGVSEYIRVNY